MVWCWTLMTFVKLWLVYLCYMVHNCCLCTLPKLSCEYLPQLIVTLPSLPWHWLCRGDGSESGWTNRWRWAYFFLASSFLHDRDVRLESWGSSPPRWPICRTPLGQEQPDSRDQGGPRGRQCASGACVSSFAPPPPSRRSTRMKSFEVARPPTRGLSLETELALAAIPTPPPIVCFLIPRGSLIHPMSSELSQRCKHFKFQMVKIRLKFWFLNKGALFVH